MVGASVNPKVRAILAGSVALRPLSADDRPATRATRPERAPRVPQDRVTISRAARARQQAEAGPA
jgi:hypothetical protein